MRKSTVKVATKPTKVLMQQSGNVKVVTQLFGEVSPERLAKEEATLWHRVEQFQPYDPNTDKYYVSREEYFEDEGEYDEE